MIKSFFIGFIIMSLALEPLLAQVNIERIRFSEDSSHYLFGLSLQSYTGNSNFISNQINFRYDGESDDWRWLLIGSIGSTVSEGDTLLNSGFVHLRGIYSYSTFQKWESFVQVKSDPQTGIDSRQLIGGGIRFEFNRYLASGVGIMRELEIRDSAMVSDLVRGTNYVSISYPLGDFSTISSTTYYQPALANLSDFRLANETDFAVRLNKSVFWKSQISYRFDSRTEPGVSPTDFELRQGLGLVF